MSSIVKTRRQIKDFLQPEEEYGEVEGKWERIKDEDEMKREDAGIK